VLASADGRHVYAIAENGVVAFRRLERTGGLRFLGCWSESGAAPCARTRALTDARSLALSPDGRSLYVAGGDNTPDDPEQWTGTLAHFRRDPRSGRLTLESCVDRQARDGCESIGNSMADATDVLVTPDGRAVLVVGLAINVFARDPTDGALTRISCITGRGRGCAGGDILVGSSTDAKVLITPDSRYIIVATTQDEQQAIFDVLSLDTGSRATVFTNCLASSPLDPCLVEPGLLASPDDSTDAMHLAQSPDGRFVYADEFALGDGMSFLILQRNQETGVLRLRGCLGELPHSQHRCRPAVRVGADPYSFLVSPDGRRFAGVDPGDGTVSLLVRHRRSGRLAPIPGRRGCMTRTGYVINPILRIHSRRQLCQRARLPGSPAALAFAPDSRELYVAGVNGIGILRVR
jgi:DNA-binding beta-propeller fold protein YncE